LATSLGTNIESTGPNKTVEQATNYFIKSSYSTLKNMKLNNYPSSEVIEDGDLMISKHFMSFRSASGYQLKLMFVSVANRYYRGSTSTSSDDSNNIKDIKNATYSVLGITIPIFIITLTNLVLFFYNGKNIADPKTKTSGALSKKEDL
jgi:hypothetical protein